MTGLVTEDKEVIDQFLYCIRLSIIFVRTLEIHIPNTMTRVVRLSARL